MKDTAISLTEHCFETFFDFNPFSNDEILDETKLKAFADNKLNYKNNISVFDRVENIVRKCW